MYLVSISTRKILLSIVILFILLSIILSPREANRDANAPVNYPWNITVNSSGQTQVMGITLGESSWVEVNQLLNKYGSLAVFDDGNNVLALEGFFGDVTIAGITGRLILRLDAPQELLQELMEGARKREAQQSGAIRYTIDHGQRRDIVDLKVKSLTYIPVVDLDEELIRHRFGDPERIIVMPDGLRHFLYSAKGLDIIVDAHGKEVLQYVLPEDIQGIIQPLIDKGGTDE